MRKEASKYNFEIEKLSAGVAVDKLALSILGLKTS